MKNCHISEAGVSFEIKFGLIIEIWAGEHICLHMAGNYRLKTCQHDISFLLFLRDSHFNYPRMPVILEVTCYESGCALLHTISGSS